MGNILIQGIKYAIILIMAFYTYFAFRVQLRASREYRQRIHRLMGVFLFLIHGLCFLSLYLTTHNKNLIWLYILQLFMFLLFDFAYKKKEQSMSQLILHNMLLLLMIGLAVITRLSFANGVQQFIIITAALFLSFVIPLVMERYQWIERMGIFYAFLGLALLVLALLFGTEYYGAKNWLKIGNFQFQPSEFSKLLFVFFVASLLRMTKKRWQRAGIVSLAACYIVVLVLEKDLGAALLFYITFLTMLYAATRKYIYLFAGVLTGVIGSYAGYVLFAHVRVRVMAFLHPFEMIEQGGYQISQSLFAIGTGGWFGVGINQGIPDTIPVASSDFIFSAIAEEFGAVFAICMILVCISCFVMFINGSVQIKNTFYKILALGFSTMYIVQVLLNVGGVLKCIPSTGITLPLVSYGGTSVVSSIFMFRVIQGVYSLHQKTEDVSRKEDYKGHLKRGRELNGMVIGFTYFFSALLYAVIGYYTYFLMIESKTVLNNPYNTRLELLARDTIRGKILSADQKILAQTILLDDNSEMRVYPFGNAFSHIVGRVEHGRTGIELLYNYSMMTSDMGAFSQLYHQLAGEKNIGNDVITSINAKLSMVAYDALGEHRGAVVVLEPATGKILVMVSKPDYNPNTIINEWKTYQDTSDAPLLNRAARGLYAPGSTFKIVTLLEYMREHKNYEEYSYTCTGEARFHGVTLHCARAHGKQNLIQSFANSCNTSFGNLGTSLSMDEFYELCKKLLFLQKLPTEITASQSSFVLDGSSDPLNYAQTVIGLGKTQMTPLHNAMITSAIANQGILMQTYVVDAICREDGKVVEQKKQKPYQALMSKEEAEVLKQYMKEVVQSGTASKLKNLAVSVAGKTGTAEYETGKKPHAWFVGFAPVDQPQIVVSVLVESAGSGSSYAVPIAKKIIQAYFSKE